MLSYPSTAGCPSKLSLWRTGTVWGFQWRIHSNNNPDEKLNTSLDICRTSTLVSGPFLHLIPIWPPPICSAVTVYVCPTAAAPYTYLKLFLKGCAIFLYCGCVSLVELTTLLFTVTGGQNEHRICREGSKTWELKWIYLQNKLLFCNNIRASFTGSFVAL